MNNDFDRLKMNVMELVVAILGVNQTLKYQGVQLHYVNVIWLLGDVKIT